MNCRCKDALSLRDHLNRSCQLLPPASSSEKETMNPEKATTTENGDAFDSNARNTNAFDSNTDSAHEHNPKKEPKTPVPKMDNGAIPIHQKDSSKKSDPQYASLSTKEPKQSAYFKSPPAGLREVSSIREEKDSVHEMRVGSGAKPDSSMDLSPTELDALLHMDMEITPEEPAKQVPQTPQKPLQNPITEPCDICRENTNDPSNYLLRCAHCGVVVHAGCYGVPDLPQGRWQCDVGVSVPSHR